MGWLSNLFKKQTESPTKTTYAEVMNGYAPIFSQFGQNIYASDVVQQAISCIVTEMKKLPRIAPSAWSKLRAYGRALPTVQIARIFAIISFHWRKTANIPLLCGSPKPLLSSNHHSKKRFNHVQH